MSSIFHSTKGGGALYKQTCWCPVVWWRNWCLGRPWSCPCPVRWAGSGQCETRTRCPCGSSSLRRGPRLSGKNWPVDAGVFRLQFLKPSSHRAYNGSIWALMKYFLLFHVIRVNTSIRCSVTIYFCFLQTKNKLEACDLLYLLWPLTTTLWSFLHWQRTKWLACTN